MYYVASIMQLVLCISYVVIFISAASIMIMYKS